MEGRVANLDRIPRVVGHHEARRAEWRFVAPPAAPAIVRPGPAGGTELVAAHDLSANAASPGRSQRLIWAEVSVRLQAAPGPDLAEPMQEVLLGVAERGIGRLPLSGGVAVEGDDEVVHSYLGHA